MSGHSTPEDAATADSVPSQYANVVAVDYSPSGEHAVVFIAYNEPPNIEPYVVLCEKSSSGWVDLVGGSGGGLSWMSTNADGSLGVETSWAPRQVHWDVPAPGEPRPPADADW